ncbi:CRISPR-associated protein Cas5 [Escherichia coli]
MRNRVWLGYTVAKTARCISLATAKGALCAACWRCC